MPSPFIGGLKKNIFLNTTLVRCVDALTLLVIFTIVFPLVGGSFLEPSNFMAICRLHHIQIHNNPRWAEAEHYLLK